MGIKGLMKLLDEEAPQCYKESERKAYFARTIAIDASMQLYQFIIQIRSAGEGGRGPAQMLMNEEGEVTSHLQGFFNRCANLLEAGIKPVFVFDGRPPTLKSGELAKRKEAKEKAEEALKAAETKHEAALEAGAGEEAVAEAVAEMDKAAKRSVHVTKEQNEEAKKLLRLMGIPVVEAPCEAEAQCAELCKGGKVFATATEDMDALTFRTPILLRKLTMPESRKEPVQEIHVEKLLGPDGLNISYDQFVDLCILLGCDYADTIKGVGPKTALKLIREHGSLEEVLKNVDRTKNAVPESYDSHLDEIRGLFKAPEVKPATEFEDFTWTPPKADELVQFLVKEKGFNEERVRKVIERINKARQGGAQMRLDSFFKPAAGAASATAGFKKTSGGSASGSGSGKKRDAAAAAAAGSSSSSSSSGKKAKKS